MIDKNKTFHFSEVATGATVVLNVKEVYAAYCQVLVMLHEAKLKDAYIHMVDCAGDFRDDMENDSRQSDFIDAIDEYRQLKKEGPELPDSPWGEDEEG